MDDARFEALCAALRRNDPNTTEIPFVAHVVPVPQCGRRLGEALQGNHYVSSIDLGIDFLLDNNEEHALYCALASLYS